MRKNRPYQARSVKQIEVAEITRDRDGMGCDLGLDTSKAELLVCLRWKNGSFERPWRVPLAETPLLIEKLRELQQGREVVIALEPTGTYCDPIRQALRDGGFKVFRVSPKASHDYAEIFDGVPSQHDGKDAACVAELAAMNKRSEWEWDLDDQALRQEVEWMDAQQKALTRWLGRIEGLLGRHWPELTGVLQLSSSTLLQLLAHYGGPEGLSGDPTAAERLRKWSGAKFEEDKVQQIVQSAKTTLGVRQRPGDVAQVQRFAAECLRIRREVHQSKRRVQRLVEAHAGMKRLAAVVGCGTSAVCWVHLDDPTTYHCGRAYLKAFGLNLKERSSGFFQGQLKITKKGPSRPRRWLYFAAMRYTQDPWIKPWYEARKKRGPGHAKRALVALMRKLALAMYQVARGGRFDVQTLLPGAKKYQEHRASKQPRRRSRSHA